MYWRSLGKVRNYLAQWANHKIARPFPALCLVPRWQAHPVTRSVVVTRRPQWRHSRRRMIRPPRLSLESSIRDWPDVVCRTWPSHLRGAPSRGPGRREPGRSCYDAPLLNGHEAGISPSGPLKHSSKMAKSSRSRSPSPSMSPGTVSPSWFT